MSQHAIDLPGLDIGQETLERRAVEIAAAIATVVVAGRKRSPTGMGLAVDVCFGGFPLGIERVEILVQTFLGAFARIDGATQRRGRRRFRLACVGHDFAPFSVRPKKKCPEQCEPVTALATALSERYVSPSNAKPCSRTSTWSVRPL